MMVPRSFQYSASPPREELDEKLGRRRSVAKVEKRKTSLAVISAPTPATPSQTTTQAMPVPKSTRRHHSGAPHSMPTVTGHVPTKSRRQAHDPNGLPPAIAALLAMTTIPPQRANQMRNRKSAHQKRISIDELVSEWKSEESLKRSYSSSPALSLLLDDTDEQDEEDEQATPVQDSYLENSSLMHTRSTSSESMPSLEADNRSTLSGETPSTPGSLRSRRSNGNLKRDRARSLRMTQETALDHPLASLQSTSDDDEEDTFVMSTPTSRLSTTKPKASFTSNLTISLQNLKRKAFQSLASFGSASSNANTSHSSLSFSDETLWSHPFLFPRFSHEVRPTIEGTPTQAQRRYLNPVPLTFEEQEAPFQQALHAPFLAESTGVLPNIPLQTYNRGRRKSATRGGPYPNSEAGRALLTATGVRQREPRENSDFLRVVVLEMNMRREGKLEHGRAKICLPPRQATVPSEEGERVPKRWVGVSAY